MSRLEFATQAEAQQCADSIHERMKAADPNGYGASVRAGKTTAWAVPYRDRDRDGNVIADSPWYVNVKDRCDGCLTAQERAAKQPDAVVRR